MQARPLGWAFFMKKGKRDMQKEEMRAKYDHLQVEDGSVYSNWCNEGYFTAGDLTKKPYSIVIPPPNVTGKLHLGHAWDTTLQDILCRYKRLQGYDVCWVPGMDHAGIATQAKVDARIKEEGYSRYDLGREKFLERAWEWKEEYASTIRQQWAKMGLSLDYSRERFTLDEGLSQAVNKVFVDLYNDGLIYQGERIINWDPEAKTALSNIEVEHKEIMGHMYYFNYQVVETGEQLVIATTRPETMFADQAIFVHPDDERYKDIVGMHIINPANGETLPIMADDYIDMSFGTAVMKCTPAHDPNDFALAKKYNLAMPICMNPDGTMNELAGKYAGMDRFECREALVADFEKAGVVNHIEEHLHQVGHSERTHVIVEPYLSKQWFVKMKPLAQAVLDNQEKEDQKISFVPPRFNHTFEQWLENIEDWCISRQLWWGHRIPAWTNNETGEIYVGTSAPEDIENWTQDEDVLDTWFSSALWPFSTLGWPNQTEDLDRYYPTNVLVTGYDIIFFWVARMAFQGRYCTDSRPFKEVLIHGLIRDNQGRKMSKSLGNGVDPMDVIADKGADALRFFLTTNSAPGLDLRYDEKKVDAAWNFINKIWNASRYVMMQLDGNPGEVDASKLSAADKWILSRLNETIESVTKNMDRYEFSMVGNELYNFVWNDFCSWYIELSKAALSSSDPQVVASTQKVLYTVLKDILILLSPFIPFVTEEIYQHLTDEETINKAQWPGKVDLQFSAQEMKEMQLLLNVIVNVREIKNTYKMKPSENLDILLKDNNGQTIKFNEEVSAMLTRMAHASAVEHLESDDVLKRSIGNVEMSIAMADLIDLEEEIEKTSKEINRLKKEIKRASGMLSNPKFVEKAPAAKVEEEKKKLATYEEQLALAEKHLSEMKSKLS
jgi:valyl-tRNA synthetase